jgi:hypothetical protein
MDNVNAGEKWPSRSCTTLTLTPAAKVMVAQVWRSPWKFSTG